jgi:hypothetical protein
MSNPSNSYAEKIYSEHPLALWALDDQADYVSLITEEQRNIGSAWNGTGGGSLPAITDITAPFQDSIITGLISDVPATTGLYLYTYSPNLVNFKDLNSNLGTFALSTYFYSDSVYLQEIQIGYEYTDPYTLEIIQKVKSFETSSYQRWSFISATFDVIDIDVEFRMIFKLRFFPGAGLPEDYKVYFNGMTAGQWSEEFNSQSLGLTVSTLPNTIALPTSDVIEAKEYQLSGNSGYYFVSNNSILGRNSGIPLVYGASNVTKLVPNENLPSVIIPGKGFLNESGRYNDYTVEFWMKINPSTQDPVRIFGPISSDSGLYVESGFLTLVIDENFKSHFITEWSRPMLIQIRIIENSASLIINGEEVFSFSINTKNMNLPSILNEYGKNQDWLGFYCTQETSQFEVDCFSIYSYNVPTTVAKRRWVYGQAVVSPEKIDSSYNGLSAYIDYPFANYVANYTYPDMAKWEQGTFDNLVTNLSSISNPKYSLPEIFLNNKTIKDLYLDCKEIQSGPEKFITFRPNETWNDLSCYFNFPKFNSINDEVHSLFGVFQINEDDMSEQILIKIYNTLTGNFFIIKKYANEIHYYLTYNGVEEQIYTSDTFVVGEKFVTGINISNLINYFGGNVATFFGNRNGLKMYVGGDENETQTFTGYIYKFGQCSLLNTSMMNMHYLNNGIAKINQIEEFMMHLASYTLFPEIEYGQYYLDIGTYGRWQDYMPLSYFAKNVKNDIGNEYYSLDFLQFNIGFPPSTNTINENNINFIDTANSEIKSFVTFQYIQNGSNLLDENFEIVALPTENKVIDLNNYVNWQNTKFEIVDNTIIYPPMNIDFNDLAIVYSVEFKNNGTLTKQINLKKLEICSQAFNNNSFNPIGTRFGVNLFPYKKSGVYYDYNTKNPFSIYKGSTPYLYLTKKSGIELKKIDESSVERGIAIPINSQTANNYKVNAFQLWLMSDYETFSDIPQELFKIEHKEDTIIFYLVANSIQKNRAKIYAKRKSTGKSYNGFAFYLNGKLVTEPTITAKEWNVIGLTFANSLNFNSYIGKLTLNGSFVFNNIATYQASSLQEIQSKIVRPWFNVKTTGLSELDWQFWSNSYIWEGVLIVSSKEAYAISPSDIYNTYVGINKIIIDDSEGMILDSEVMKIYTNTTWSSSVHTPV